jgi:hypothetical protein
MTLLLQQESINGTVLALIISGDFSLVVDTFADRIDTIGKIERCDFSVRRTLEAMRAVGIVEIADNFSHGIQAARYCRRAGTKIKEEMVFPARRNAWVLPL